MTTRFHRKPLLFLALFAFSQASHATPLARGSSITLGGVTAATHPEFAGSVLADKLIPFEVRGFGDAVILTGTYQSRVIRSSTTGKLVFSGRIRDLANPPDTFGWVTHARMEGFGYVDTDVHARSDTLGDVLATRAARNVAGDWLTFTIGPGLLNPPDESKTFGALTTADEFDESGSVTIFASNDFGGTSFSVTIEGAHAPVKPPLSLSIGERFFFETLFYHPIEVRGAAEGVVLKVETSPDLMTWTTQAGSGQTAVAGTSLVFGEVDPDSGGRQFFRVFCELPGE